MVRVFGKKKFIRDISASSFQTLITQVFALVIFYYMSKYLPKEDFGEYSWAAAVGFTLIAIASFGLDQVFIKRVASGDDVLTVSGMHLFHTLVVGIVLTAVIYAIRFVFPSFSDRHPLFLYVFISVAVINVATSFKLCLYGLEAYRNLAIQALVVNLLKLGAVLALYICNLFNIHLIVLSFIVTAVAELAMGYYLTAKSIRARVKPLFRVVEYRYFILESLPQLGVVIFDSALSRLDIILMGIMSTPVSTGEYSFVFKIYELSKLPMVMVAPVLLTRFSKILAHGNEVSPERKRNIRLFSRAEIFAIMVLPIILVCTWTPLVDHFTNGKYGAVNELNYRILAACVPLICIVNFMWTLGFVQGQLKATMLITASVSIINIVLNILLIPSMAGTGASVAFLITCIVQVALYLIFIRQDKIKFDLPTAALLFVYAAIAVLCAFFATNSIIFRPLLALAVYCVLTVVTGQLNYKMIMSAISKSKQEGER
jgi:O-antigen/teichoic acid export membrane protein